MDKPEMTRDEISEILLDDLVSHLLVVPVPVCLPMNTGMSTGEMREEAEYLWRRVAQEIARVKAERLLDPTFTGPLMSRIQIRQIIIRCVFELRTFEVLRDRQVQVGEVIADFTLGLSHPAALDETYEHCWASLTTIVVLARSYGVTPLQFLKFPNAVDWVLRGTTSPKAFRQAQRENVNNRHPDLVEPHCLAFAKGMAQVHALSEREAAQFRDKILRIVLRGDAYWEHRGRVYAQIEEIIDRVWPGNALSKDTNITPDA